MSNTQARSGRAQSTALHLILILLLGILAYSNTFDVPFVFDDGINIVENTLVKNFSSFFGEPSKEGVNLAVYTSFNNRIVGYLSFALNFALHGLDVRGYHAVNLAIHIINALLLYWLVILTFRTPHLKGSGLRESSRYIALFSALLFVSHPVQTQAVTYIVQRFASLTALFYLLSLTLYIRCRLNSTLNLKSITLYALSFISAVLAMKTKEIAFTLPLIIALYEFLFFRDSLKRKLLYLIPLFLTLLIIPLSMLDIDRPFGEIIGDVGEAARLHTDISRLDYLFTQSRVVTTYIRLLFLPINQNLDYDYPILHSFFDPQVFLSFLLLASIMGLGVFLLWRSRTSGPALRVISFGIFWFFITLSVESGLIPIRDVIFEHRVYLPSLGVVMATATGAAIALQRLKGERLKAAATALIVIAPLVLTAAAYKRNAVWQSGLTLWEDVVRKAPGNARAHFNTGVAYEVRGLMDKAIERYSAAIRLKPFSGESPIPEAHKNLGNVYAAQGLHKKAIEHFRAAIALAPGYATAHYSLGNAYAAQGLHKKAIEHFRAAITFQPDHSHAYNNLGNVYLAKGLFYKAIEQYERAVEIEPDNIVALVNLGITYNSEGRPDRAAEYLERAIALKPDIAKAHYHLGNVYLDRGLFYKAIEQYERTIEIEPDNIVALVNLGISYKKTGRIDKAIKHYEAAVRLEPDTSDPYYNLANAYMRQDRIDEAIALYEKAVSLSPDDPDFHNNLGVAYSKMGLEDKAREHFRIAESLK